MPEQMGQGTVWQTAVRQHLPADVKLNRRWWWWWWCEAGRGCLLLFSGTWRMRGCFFVINVFNIQQVCETSHVFSDQLTVNKCNDTAFIHSRAALAFSLKCYPVLRWEIGSTDFPEHQSLLPFTHDLQGMFLNISGTDCMRERGFNLTVFTTDLRINLLTEKILFDNSVWRVQEKTWIKRVTKSRESPPWDHSLGVTGSSSTHRLRRLLENVYIASEPAGLRERGDRGTHRMWSKCSPREHRQRVPLRLPHDYITGPHYPAPVSQHRSSPPLLLFHSSQPPFCFLSFDLFTAEPAFQCSFNPSSVHSPNPPSSHTPHYFSYLNPLSRSPGL